MRRWKFTPANLFQGRHGLIYGPLLILPTAALYIVLVVGIVKGDPVRLPSLTLLLTVILGILLIIWLTAFLVLHSKTDEEREKIANAAPVEWLPVSEDDLIRIRKRPNRVWVSLAVTAGIIGCSLIWTGLENGSFAGLGMAALLFGGIVAAVLLIYYANWRFWHGIDESAEVAELPVDHCFSRTYSTRSGKRTDFYQVCYLPDGRYVFNIGEFQPKSVRILRFRGRMRLLPPQQYGG